MCQAREQHVRALSESIEEVRVEQNQLQRQINAQAAEQATVAQQMGRVEDSLRHYQLGFSGRLDTINLQNTRDHGPD